MEIVQKYGLLRLPIRGYRRFSRGEFFESRRGLLREGSLASGEKKLLAKAGDSWVLVTCEIENEHYDVKFSENRRPGLSSINTPAKPNENLVSQVKILGTSYRQGAIRKGSRILKQRKAMKTISIKKILIPTDFSDTGMLAMEHAIFMARLLKAELYLLHVVEAYEYTYSIYEPEAIVRDTAGINEIAHEKLDKLASRITKENGINVKTLVESGKPASEISGLVKDYGIDLIVMGTHGAQGFEEYFIGSNAQKVANLAPCPVITVQEHTKQLGFKNIVMPIDNSLYSRQKVDYVIKLATLYDSKVHILGLLNSDEELDERKFNIKLDSVEHALKNADIRYIRKISRGKNIAEEAMKYSEAVKGDLLVIMTDHESTLKGALLGSFAKQIVNHSRIPVMSIHPLPEGHIDMGPMSAANPLF